MTKQQHKLISELKELYRGKYQINTAIKLEKACSQLKLAEWCRALGIGIKKYKWDACKALAAAIHSN